jgi:hypothetical protein
VLLPPGDEGLDGEEARRGLEVFGESSREGASSRLASVRVASGVLCGLSLPCVLCGLGVLWVLWVLWVGAALRDDGATRSWVRDS